MHCKKCGHALGTNQAVCPNCGSMMDNNQLRIRKEINGANNPYMARLENIKNKNEMYKSEERSDTNNIGYAIFIALILIVFTVIISLILIRR